MACGIGLPSPSTNWSTLWYIPEYAPNVYMSFLMLVIVSSNETPIGVKEKFVLYTQIKETMTFDQRNHGVALD